MTDPLLGEKGAPARTDMQLTAGRELDELVAERVFGWYYEDDDGTWRKGRRGNLVMLAENLPAYSTDIAAAWGVVEKMAQDWDFYLRFVSAWTADFVVTRSGETETADADTAPLAICLAALNAMESR